MSAIVDRLDTALERARWRYPESPPKCIYLTEDDWREFDVAMSLAWGSKMHCFQYRDLDIRSGKTSRIVTTCGALVAVPMRLSPRTGAAAG